MKDRERRQLRTARNDRGRYTRWIAPVIGTIAIASITKSDLRRLVASLDTAVRARKLAWKTAINVWGVATKLFADTCNSKIEALLVRQDDPSADVRGPDRGGERSAPYLFPAELEQLVSCELIPVRRRRLYVLATYLYVRGAELEVLEWEDVNLERAYVQVHRAVNTDTGRVGPTKSKQTRKVPIEPSLAPLLHAMRVECNGVGRVTWTNHHSERAWQLREDLKKAGLTRAELFANDATRRRIDFHDLRHTGITWRAIRGDQPIKIREAAGHSDLDMTLAYVNEAETFDIERFGVPFPPLPANILPATTAPSPSDPVRADGAAMSAVCTARPSMHLHLVASTVESAPCSIDSASALCTSLPSTDVRRITPPTTSARCAIAPPPMAPAPYSATSPVAASLAPETLRCAIDALHQPTSLRGRKSPAGVKAQFRPSAPNRAKFLASPGGFENAQSKRLTGILLNPPHQVTMNQAI